MRFHILRTTRWLCIGAIGLTAFTSLVFGQEPVAPKLQRLPPANSSNTDDRLQSLELRLEEQRAISESLQHQLEWQQAEKVAKDKAAKEAEKKPYKVGSVLGMVPVWNNGVEFRSPNKDYYFHVGGRTQLDVIALSSPDDVAALTNTQQSPNDGLQDAVDFRRARLRAEGAMYELFEWCVEYNFVTPVLVQAPNYTGANPQVPNGNYPNTGSGIRALETQVINTPAPTDLWWSIKKIPYIGNFTIGNQKDPVSLEHLISSRYLDFLERTYGQDAFVGPNNNGFSPGMMVWNWTKDKRSAYAVGVFKNNFSNPYAFDVGDGEFEVAGRITRALIYDEPAEGRYLLHVGVSAAQRGTANGQIRYRARGALYNGPTPIIPILADTGFMNADLQRILVPELLFQWGPVFLMSEFQANWTTNVVTIPGSATSPFQPAAPARDLGNLFFYTYYVTVGWFLTGEHKIYDFQKGMVGRIIPFENAFIAKGPNGPCFGRGAWQVLARFQQLNLNNSAVAGGRITDFTFGVNWFLNPNMKLQFNYDLQFRGAGGTPDFAGGGTKGVINGFGFRFASDF